MVCVHTLTSFKCFLVISILTVSPFVVEEIDIGGDTKDENVDNNNEDDDEVNETGVGREVNMKPNTKLEEASEILTQPGILAGE